MYLFNDMFSEWKERNTATLLREFNVLQYSLRISKLLQYFYYI